MSHVYVADPELHPQTEEYWGHVNPIGPRACYDEGKRVAETMCYAYQKQVRTQPLQLLSVTTSRSVASQFRNSCCLLHRLVALSV